MSLVNLTPTTVFTGFLGSGKTTIISSLIQELIDSGLKPAYIKNEIGETDIDAELFRGKNFIAQELLNGCICCTLVGPFFSAIDEIIATIKPDRIIIESAGTADPASLALMVEQHPKLLRDGVIGVIDVLNFTGYGNLSGVAQQQAKLTDLLIFNKIEQVSLEQKKKIVGYVRELNQYSPIIEAPAGKVSSELIFGLDTAQTQRLLEDTGRSNHEHDHSEHAHQDGIDAFTFATEQLLDKKELQKTLSTLPNNIFRVKGYARFSDGTSQLVNGVYKRIEYFQPEKEQKILSTKLVFIGYHTAETQSQVLALLNNQNHQNLD